MRKDQYKKGQAVMVGVIFFVFTSLSIVLSLSYGITSGLKVSREGFAAQESYYASESGLEDTLYRLKTGKNVSTVELLTVGSTTATTTIFDIGGGQKQVVASSTNKDVYTRKIRAIVSATIGISFPYSIHVGQGGFSLAGNAVVNGNVYTSGNVQGVSGGSEQVNGNVIAANSSAFTQNQSNEGASTPPNTINIGRTTNPDVAQSFMISSTTPLNKIEVYLRKTGNPGNLTVRLLDGTSTSTQPGSTQIASASLSSASTTGSYGWKEVYFSPTPSLAENTPYWVVLDGGSSNSNYYTIGAVSGYAPGTAKIGTYNSSWGATSPSGLDVYFRVYTGGFTSTVSNIAVNAYGPTGSAGDVWSHTITNVSAQGTLTCQTGSGNNKSCVVSADPDPQPMPITSATVASLKAGAAAGGTYGSTNLVLANNETLSVGPKVINGNLDLSGNSILTLTGALHVKGSVLISGNAVVKLDPSYGANDGAIVTDNALNLSGNSAFQGSGTSGSFILLLTTSTNGVAACTSPYAISLSGNSGAIILAAPFGSIQLTSNAAVNNAIAYRMCIDGNSSATYDAGKSQANISTGGADWSINEWKEFE